MIESLNIERILGGCISVFF